MIILLILRNFAEIAICFCGEVFSLCVVRIESGEVVIY